MDTVDMHTLTNSLCSQNVLSNRSVTSYQLGLCVQLAFTCKNAKCVSHCVQC